ncbi:predicted protein [Naegleria gruberi]|uniref:Predicted protein n=1 Tax=Naegleria gruberi TaxID=5762 RepID=D2VIN4_NAEGR|nr:uncharacterized protein NAEGRDRAFT_49855 [Naegleria gruberi]EFC43383.1 predicted protein [Naegleria gruberi]|eukprot:XP_002676127.1 predicted protein [Naegleria gruberi strain NEG-M]
MNKTKGLTQQPERFKCSYESCTHSGQTFSEDELITHCLQVHCRENTKQVCPICLKRDLDDSLKGSRQWGFSTHIYNEHGFKATPEQRKKDEIDYQNSLKPTYSFALVIIRNPVSGKFLLVEEGCSQGWWLPAGRVDPGETFQQAALRETLEEAGIHVELKNILRFEYSPYHDGGARSRVIFYAEPLEEDPVLKSIPDFESVCAKWFSYEEFENDFLQKRTKKLRGMEPFQWFKYVHEGKPMYPLSMLTLEGAP